MQHGAERQDSTAHQQEKKQEKKTRGSPAHLNMKNQKQKNDSMGTKKKGNL